MNIFLLNRRLEVVSILSSKGDINGISPFFNDKYIQYLETGAETFEFEMIDNKDLELCSYVVFRYKDDYKLFQIVDIKDLHEDNVIIKNVYCETSGLELRNDTIRPRSIPSANFEQLLQIILNETDWNVGYVDDSINDVHTVEIDTHKKVYDFLQEEMKLYKCEIKFRVEFKGNKVVGKYVDAYKTRGEVTNIRFEYSKNLNSVERNVNSYELATSLIGVGKDGIDFKKVEWLKSDGDPCDKPLGQDFVEDEEAFDNWNNNGYGITDTFECDSESPAELLLLTWKELQKRKEPKIDYEVDVAIFDNEIEIGDEIYVIDNEFENPLHLSARVNELTISFTNKEYNKCVFSNYKKVKSKITDEMRNIKNELTNVLNQNLNGVSKGGFLNSRLIVNGFNIQIKNKLLNEQGKDYYFDIENKKITDFLVNKTSAHTTVTQGFVIDTIENYVYIVQLNGGKDLGNLVISKVNFNGDIVGKMYLEGFGHGYLGIDNMGGEIHLWCECDGVLASNGSMYGSKICRFKFEDGKTYNKHTGNVYNILPNMDRLTVATDTNSNKLVVRARDLSNKKYYFHVYELDSVVNNKPVLLYKIYCPTGLHTSDAPGQGFAICGDYIYHINGYGYDQTNGENNTKISVLNTKGTLLYSKLVTHALGLEHREPEGIFLTQNDRNVELYFNFASGKTGARRYNIYKYNDIIGSEYELRGNFLHNNGHTAAINEGNIATGLDGSKRRNAYLMYSDTSDSSFIVSQFRNGKFYVEDKEYTPGVNDSVVAEIKEDADNINLTVLTSDYEAMKGQDGAPGQDALFLELTNEYHSIPTDANGNNGIYNGCETELNLYRGDIQLTNNVTYSVNSSENVTGNLANNKYTVTSITGDAGYVDLAVNYLGNEYIKRFSLSKNKQGLGGEDGTNGTSPTVVTISGQQSMKYLDKTTAPTPSTITLTTDIKEGSTVVSSGATYIWQYKNSSGTWVNLSGIYTNKTYSLAHNNTGFINEVAQVRVAVSYKSKTYYAEHTVTKIYDNKYISKQEVFDKITEGGVNQLIYKDPSTGEIYINATFIKSGQLVADLIKGGILTLGGSIGADDNPVNGYIRVLGADNQELAVLNGGEMSINGLSSDEATIDNLYVNEINSPKIAPCVLENITIYVNKTSGSDDVIFDNGAKFQTIQAAIDSVPKNLNGFTITLRLESKSDGNVETYSENLLMRGFYGGSFNLWMQGNNINGNIRFSDCSARMFLAGGTSLSGIADGVSVSKPNIKPSSLVESGGYYYSILSQGCSMVYIRSVNVYGVTTADETNNYCIGARDAANVFVRNVKLNSSQNGFHAQLMGRLITDETYGKVKQYAYRANYGGSMTISSGSATSGSTNTSVGDGCVISQGSITWDGQSSTGSNDNTTTNTETETFTSSSGDTYKVKYSSWRKDNTVRQGDWSSTGLNRGCWFFGSQFSSLKGKTIKSVKLTIQRQSSGGNSGAVAFTLKMHNHSSRPSGAPSYLSGWSKNVSLSLGQSSTVTITDSAVLTAIKNGTMKGFGIEVSSTSNSYYGILSPKLKAVVTYS